MASWTDERVERLKKLWGEGLSANEVARALGGVTRNAVLGKVHRMGMSERDQKNSRPRKTYSRPRLKHKQEPPARVIDKRSAHLSAPRPPRVSMKPIVEPMDIPQHQRKTVLTLENDSCRWPVGEPQAEDFYFCGGEAVEGLPYCLAHSMRAYEAKKPKTLPRLQPVEASNQNAPTDRKKEVCETP